MYLRVSYIEFMNSTLYIDITIYLQYVLHIYLHYISIEYTVYLYVMTYNIDLLQ